MSCFVVSAFHTNAIASWAHARGLECAADPERLAADLHAANCAAYDERYSNDSIRALLTAPVEAPAYPFRPVDPIRQGLSPVAIVKACDCLEYQCADFGGWEGSKLEGELDSIRRAALEDIGWRWAPLADPTTSTRFIPGYEEAEWELKESRDTRELFDPDVWQGLELMRARNFYRDAAADLVESLRECVTALEAAGADGGPGDMPAPELDRARQLLARLGSGL
jgi:hypothetical protein